jgi:Tol biopolymer transport system component
MAICILVACITSSFAKEQSSDIKPIIEPEVKPSVINEPGNLPSANAATSADGRFIAFHSAASNLVPDDTNNKQDIFVFDRETKKMQRISISSSGEQADDYSLRPSISGDGRFVAFMSYAKNLVDHDHNHQLDVYIHDRQKNTTELVSVSTEGKAGNTKSMNPTISSDGRFVAFESFSNNLIVEDINENPDIFVRNIPESKTEVISLSSRGQQANHGSSNPSISADGRYVLFQSPARNLVPIDNKRSDENEWNFSDVFLRDRELGKTELISVNQEGKPGNHPSGSPSVSQDGQFVAFTSMATDLVDNYPMGPLELSGKGFTARRIDIYVRDRGTNLTKLVSAAPSGEPGNHQSQAPKISANGQFVIFQSAASNLTSSRMPGTTINIYQRDIVKDETTLVTEFKGPQETNVMSAHSAVTQNGSFVVFDTNYGHQGAELANNSDVYIWNSTTGEIELISFSTPTPLSTEE